ncbi:MAG: Crp/Fnr family transcriptional regulator [Azospirillaceae bacterium]|nr:Crp/Fnr family transcriptional regulator [Azospirillaceae bacterium]
MTRRIAVAAQLPSDVVDFRKTCGITSTTEIGVDIGVDDQTSGLPCRPSHRERRSTGHTDQLSASDWRVIRAVPLFTALDRALLSRLVASGRVRALWRGDQVFHQGDEARHLFLLLDGCVKIYRTSRQGTHTVQEIAENGATFAEESAFVARVHPASAEAVCDSRVLELPARCLNDSFAESPSLARAVVATLSARLTAQMLELERAYRLTGAQRLAGFLSLMFAADDHQATGHLPCDKNVLAARLGMTPESLSRAFVVLRDEGVRTRYRDIYVEDVAELRAYAALDEE